MKDLRRRVVVGLLMYASWTARVGRCLSAVVRYRARVAYDGTSFQGFQVQANGQRTVQACLEKVLTQRCNQQGVVRVIAAGRTDTGVHARGQAVHFDLPDFLTTDEVRNVEESLNKMLPPDVCVWNLQHAPPPLQKTFQTETGATTTKNMTWNVLYDSTRKLYSYRLSLAPVMDPLQRYHRWHPDALKGKPVEPDKLRRLIRYYEGTHDFRAFAGSIEQLQKKCGGRHINTTRTVYSADLIDEGNGCFRIDFLLKGALYKQVRNMVGTAVDAARGVLSENEFRGLIHQDDEGCSSLEVDDGGDKRGPRFTRAFNPSKPAPPEGLTLEHVYFGNDADDF